MTAQNATGSEQRSQAGHELLRKASKLRGLVGQFRIHGERDISHAI